MVVELPDTAESVVVEGDHIVSAQLDFVDTAVRTEGIPAFPGSRGAAQHLIHPAGALFLQEEVKGQLCLAIIGQQRQDVFGGKKARLHAFFLDLDI